MTTTAEEQTAEEQTPEPEAPDETPEAKADDEAPEAEADDAPEAEAERRSRAEGQCGRRRRGSAETTAGSPKRAAPRRDTGEVVVRARAKYVRSAPRKARLVMDHIRGRDVERARAMLEHAPRAVSVDILKLLNSAVANAESNYELGADELRIARAYVDEGPTIKRYRPRALGRATQHPQAHEPHDNRAYERNEVAVGQKVHPEAMRVGYIHDWKSTWFNEKEFSDYLLEDIHIRDHIENKLAHAGLSSITIKKNKTEIEVNIHTARPGIVIGKSGIEVDGLRKELHKMTNKAVKVNILEIKRPELDAKLVAQSIAEQLQNRVAFRRAMKRSLTSAMRSGAKGVKVQVSGRLGGAEMARTEGYSDGRVPLHTLRADIDYGFYEARTTFGRIGVKVWINKGEIMPKGFAQDLTDLEAPQTVGPGGGRGGRGGGRGPRGGN